MLDTYGRIVRSASPQNPTLIRIQVTQSAAVGFTQSLRKTKMKLRLRLLESWTQMESKLLQEMHVLNFEKCDFAKLPLQNGTLTRAEPRKGALTVVAAFVHHSRVFYIDQNKDSSNILSDNGRFFTKLPQFFDQDAGFWQRGGFISYEDTLLFVPEPRRTHERFYRSVPLLSSEDIFHTYEFIFYELQENYFELLRSMDEYERINYFIKSVVMYHSELLAISAFGAEYYNGKDWEPYRMNGLLGKLHIDAHLMVWLKVVNIKLAADRELQKLYFG